MAGTIALTEWGSAGPEERARLIGRPEGALKMFDPELSRSVGEIVLDVKENGDDAIVRALSRFDGCEVEPDRIRVSEEEFERARAGIDPDLAAAIRVGIDNVRSFSERAIADLDWREEIAEGLVVGEKATPIESAGLFVPSGKGSYPSVLIQIGAPAVTAKVANIAVVVPPVAGGGGEVDPGVLFVASELGISDVFRVNGPAGIAALAFGTETVPQVLQVVGPGSPPVSAAQIECQRYGCVTRMVLGPSASVIVADRTADRELLAADLLNEAEHGPDSASVLVTDSRELIEEVEEPLARRLAELPEPRREYAAKALANGGAILTSDLAETAEVANQFAPEHLQVAVAEEREEEMIGMLVNAGEILVGQQTPIAAANYVLGVPAALPTGRFARVSSGITAETFLKKASIAKASQAALARLADSIVVLAEHEGFPAHAEAVRARAASRD